MHLRTFILSVLAVLACAGWPIPARAQATMPGTAEPSPAATGATGSAGDFPAGSPSPAPDELIAGVLWTADALQRVLADRDYPAILAVAALNRAVAATGDAALEGVGPLLSALSRRAGAPTRLQRCRLLDDPVEGTLCALEELTPLAPAQLARGLADEGARLLGLTLNGVPPSLSPALLNYTLAERAHGLRSYGALDPLQRFAESALEDAWQLAGLTRGASLNDSVEQLLGVVLGVSPRDGMGAVLERSTQLRGLIEQHPVVDLLTGGPADLGQLLGHYQGFLGSVTGPIGQLVSAAQDQGAALNGLTSLLDNPRDQLLDWAANRSFAYLASRSAVLGGGEAAVADRIRTLGQAAADLRRGAASFSSQLGSVGQQAAMLALGGNVFNMALGISSFFGLTPGALGPDAAREVRVLREAVDTLREQMHGRFDHVELALDSVFIVLDTRFGRLEQLVASSNRDVQQQIRSLHGDIAALGERLDRMEGSLLSYMQAGFDREYNRTLVLCLEHRERYLPPFDQMDFATFTGCLASFRARAVQDARDALLTDQSTGVDDASLAAALADTSLYSLGRRATLLGRVAEQRFGYGAMRGGRGIANPVEWAVASQAYLRMLHDWPEHARAVAPGDLEAMRLAGNEAAAALAAIAQDPPGSAASSSGGLIRRVLGYYQSRGAELRAEADVLARRHQQAELMRVSPDSLLRRVDPTRQEHPAVPVPPRLRAAVPQEVRTAAVLGLGDVSLAYRLEHEDSVLRQNVRRRVLIFGKRHDRLTYTRSHVTVELRFGDLGTISTYRASTPAVLRLTEEIKGDVDSDQVASRSEAIPDLAAYFAAVHWPTLAADARAWTLAPVPGATLTSLERRIEAELQRHASAALENAFAAICERAGARPLSAEDAASASRMRAALDGMTAARTVLEAAVRLGLPLSAENDPALRAALFDRNGMLPQPLPLLEQTLRELDAAARLQRVRALAARAN
jgi:hypothetical protein